MTVKLVALYPLLVLPYFVGRTAGGICILSQLRSDSPFESAAGFQHALPQGPLSQPPLSAALPNNLPGHGAMSKMWEKYLCCSLLHTWPLTLQLSLIPLKSWEATFGSARLVASQLCSVHACSSHLLPSCIPHSIPRCR